MRRETSIAALVIAAVVWPASAAADSIYLKNGRVIRTSSAEVVGDRVLFTQFGHPVAIPLDQVDRIVDDGFEDPKPTPITPLPPADEAPPTAGERAAAAAALLAPDDDDPEQSRDYWQNRVRSINREAEELALEMRTLRRTERAFLFAHRSTAEIRQRKEALQARIDANANALPELRREARQKGIPPGWLRLPSGG